MAINEILETGNRGLITNRRALQTTSNNISNANTPGYSRQKSVIVNLPPSTVEGLTIGSGSEVKKIVRVHDAFVQKQLVDENQAFGALRAKTENLNHFEALVQKGGTQINDMMNRFFNDFRQLSSNVENSSLKNVVYNSAVSLADGFRQMNRSLEVGREQLDLRVADTINQVNVMLKEVAGLNDTIQLAEGRGEAPNELYDRRDLVLRDLSQKINFQLTENQMGQQTLVCGGTVLVQGNQSTELEAKRTPAQGEKASGGMTVFALSGGQPRDITVGIQNGELGGLIHVRDKVINPAIEHLDRVAHSVATSVNQVHSLGEGGAEGKGNLFKISDTPAGAAFSFEVADSIMGNPERIAAGFSANAPGDNRLALQMAELQEQKLIPKSELGDGVFHTFNESMNDLVANVGIAANRDNQLFDHQKSVVNQLENYRDSYSGVSIEEEAVDMIKYQTVFNASAKAMKVGEELLQTILSLKN